MDTDTDYLSQFSGRFENILRWSMLDELWGVLRSGSEHKQLLTLIDELDALLHKDHDEDYCGIVYVDSRREPKMIKVLDPNNLGASCGSSGMTVLPAWVISQLSPVDLPMTFPVPNNRRRWWQGLFGL